MTAYHLRSPPEGMLPIVRSKGELSTRSIFLTKVVRYIVELKPERRTVSVGFPVDKRMPYASNFFGLKMRNFWLSGQIMERCTYLMMRAPSSKSLCMDLLVRPQSRLITYLLTVRKARQYKLWLLLKVRPNGSW